MTNLPLGLLRLLLLPLLAVAASPAGAQDVVSDGPAVVILDGSGSMWGNVGAERQSKFDLARAALRQSLSSLSPRVRLGLMSFGHRRRADCSDVEVLAAPEAGPADRIPSLVDGLNPKGKGPLALALRDAGKQIPANEAGTIIVIHDGVDNCAQDPCASAAEIAATSPATRIYVISIGLEKADVQRMRCVADATKSKAFDVQDPATLGAAISEALALAKLEHVDPVSGTVVPQPKAAALPNPEGAPGIRLSAALSEGGQPIVAAVLTVAAADQPATPLKSVRGRELTMDLAPGSYIVDARFGLASAKQTVAVAADKPTVVQLSLEAGHLKLTARADKAGAPLSEPFVTVSAKDGEGKPLRPVWIGREGDASLVLPAGTYTVRVQDGLAEQTADVTLAAGAGAELTPVLGTGRLELSAIASATDEAMTDVTYSIEEDDPYAPQGRREVARSASPVASFTLPNGTYYVSARSGVAETRDRIALGSGAVVKHVASFNLVQLQVTARASGAAAARLTAEPILIRILSDDTAGREIARANGASGAFQLPAARYRVEATVGGLNVKTLGVVDLTSGRGGSVELALQSGEVAVLGDSPSGRWRIKDGEGRTVVHSGPGLSASTLLAPGRYVLISDGGDRRSETAFELKPGERRELAVGTP